MFWGGGGLGCRAGEEKWEGRPWDRPLVSRDQEGACAGGRGG